MHSKIRLPIIGAFAAWVMVSSGQAQSVLVYDNLGTSATAGYSQLNSDNPIFGDTLTLVQAGQLSTLGLSLYNSASGGNTGSILTGTMVVYFFDNTTPYAGGAITGTLLGQATLNWDFTSVDGLPPGYYTTATYDLTSLDIELTQNILITQQFTETSGTSLRNGVVLFGDPTVGSSPNTVYISSSSVSAGLYTFSGNPGQFGYEIEIIPEPSTFALVSLGLVALVALRRLK